MGSATRVWDMAFYAVPFRPGDRIRASVHYYNDEAEVERFVRALAG